MLTSPIQIDVHDLFTACKSGDAVTAAGIYCGKFLSTANVPSSEGMREWCDGIAARAHNAYVGVLREAFVRANSACDWETCTWASFKLHELGEHDRHMDAQAKEIGQITSELAELDNATSNEGMTRFVGRAAEVKALRQIWEAVKPNTCSVCVVVGESGIGKTRVALQIARTAAIQGANTVEIHCYETERHVAFGPVLEAVKGLPQKILLGCPNHLQEALAIIGLEVKGPRPTIFDNTVLATKQIIFDAISHVVVAASDNRKLLIWVDDLQWCDDSTLEWLHNFRRNYKGNGACIVGCLRNDMAVSKGVHTWMTSQDIVQLDLHPLAEADAAQLITAATASASKSISHEKREEIVAQCAGNPFYIVAMTKDVIERDEIIGGESYKLPSSVQRLIQGRVDELTPHARTLAQILAAAGTGVSITALINASGLSAYPLDEAISELAQWRLITANPIDLSHDLVKRGIYSAMPLPVRQLRHRHLFYALRGEERHSRLAIHANEAKLLEEAFTHASLAAEEATNAFAYEDARHYWEMALANASDDSQRKQTLVRILEVLNSLDKQNESIPHLSECLLLCHQHKDDDGLVLCELYRISLALASQACDVSILWNDLVTLLPKAIALNNDVRTKAALRLAVQFLQYTVDNQEMARIVALIEHTSVELTASTKTEILSMLTLGMALAGEEPALATAQEAVKLARNIGDKRQIVRALSASSTAKLLLGDVLGALRDIDLAEEEARDEAFGDTMYNHYTNRAAIFFDQGKFELARKANEQALACPSRHHVVPTINEATGCHHERRWPDVIGKSNEVLELNKWMKAVWVDVAATSLIGIAFLEMGDIQRAMAAAVALEEMLQIRKVILTDWSYTTILLSRVHVLNGREAEAIDGLTTEINKKRNSYPFGKCRMELELAKLMLANKPDSAFRLARTAKDRATHIDGRTLMREADCVLDDPRVLAS